jgi:serine/threonine-protein kinase
VGGELDARSDLFSVGTMLYLLTTGRKPFDGPTDLDVLMQVRKARFEKPSELVKDFNPDVERFIARALRADRSRRWQTATQMADRLDVILLKLGQPSGPGALKRWLSALGAKDGVLPPADLAAEAPESVTGTIQLGTRDLELEGLSAAKAVVPDEAVDEPASELSDDDDAYVDLTTGTADQDERSTRRERPPSRPSAPALAAAEGAAASEASRARSDVAPPPSDLLDAEAMYTAPTRLARIARAVRRTTIGAFVTLIVLGAAGYFARPYLPARVVDPVKTWIQALPARLDAERARLWSP